MSIYRLAFTVAALFATGVEAQGASAPPTSAAQITQLAAQDQNAYVAFLQGFLKDRNLYAGPQSGQMTKTTLRAVMKFCREAEIAELCGRGPLLPAAVAAMAAVIAADLTPAVAVVETPPPEATVVVPADQTTEVLAVAPEAPLSLPDGWRLTPSGDIGIMAEVLSVGSHEATIRFFGTATLAGYYNVEFTRVQLTESAAWTMTIEASQEDVLGGGPAAPVWLRTAKVDSKGYAGELFEGVLLPNAKAPQLLRATATVSADLLLIHPYVQLGVTRGASIDTTIHLVRPTLTKAN